jgi:hypothetical protein
LLELLEPVLESKEEAEGGQQQNREKGAVKQTSNWWQRSELQRRKEIAI